jgi:hypothetical protein
LEHSLCLCKARVLRELQQLAPVSPFVQIALLLQPRFTVAQDSHDDNAVIFDVERFGNQPMKAEWQSFK